MTIKLLANSERSLNDALSTIAKTWREKKYCRITLSTGRDRSLDQNALWFAMYERISTYKGDGSAADIRYWRAHCKLSCGVPILQAHSDEFRARWNSIVLCNPNFQNWEAQINLMMDPMFGQDGFPVTRLMDTSQGAEYTDSIVRHFPDVYFEDLLDDSDKPKRSSR
jgi:hypothetical protein